LSLAKIVLMMWKDITVERRGKETLSAMFIFSALVIVVFAFSFIRPGTVVSPDSFPGIIWITVTFSGLLGLNRSFLWEKNNDCLMGLLLAPIDKSVIYFGKVAANFIFLTLIEGVSLPLLTVFLKLQVQGSIWYLVLVIFLGTLGFTGTGVFLAALSSNTRTSEILLPVILFPILIPLFLAAVRATDIIISGGLTDPDLWAAFWSWIRLIVVYDVVFLAVPFVLFDFVLEV